MTPDQIDLCQRLAAEAAQYRWARELSDDSRRSEAEDARVEHRVGFRCDPKATRAWWAVWEPAYLAALEARATVRAAPAPDAWAGVIHREHATRAARHARTALTRCIAHASKAGDGACERLAEMQVRLDRIEAWCRDGGFIDVSVIGPRCTSTVPSLPWVADPFGAMRHLAGLVATGLPDQWAFHEEQALHAAASTLASLDDPRRGDAYRSQREAHLRALAVEARP